jgi:hypothetical protein
MKTMKDMKTGRAGGCCGRSSFLLFMYFMVKLYRNG